MDTFDYFPQNMFLPENCLLMDRIPTHNVEDSLLMESLNYSVLVASVQHKEDNIFRPTWSYPTW